MKRAFSFSGGGFRLCQHSATSKALLQHYGTPELLIGVSAGAIQVMVTALQKDDEIKDIVTSPNLMKMVFGGRRTNPFNKRGKLSAWAGIRFGKGMIQGKPVYLGDHRELANTYKKIITKDDYYSCTSKVGVMACDLDTGSRKVFWNRETSYENFVLAVLASSCIPPYMTPINIQGRTYADGGLRDHSPAGWLMENESVEEVIEVFARPKSLQGMLSPVENMPFKVVERMMGIMLNEVSKSDEVISRKLSELKFIYLTQLYQPSILKGTFDADPQRLETAYKVTYEKIQEQLSRSIA